MKLRTLATITALVLISATVHSDAITRTLTWNPSLTSPTNDAATAYNVKQSRDGSAYVTLATVPANITSYVVTVTQTGNYTWVVTATNQVAESQPSNIASNNIIAVWPPAPPTGCTVK